MPLNQFHHRSISGTVSLRLRGMRTLSICPEKAEVGARRSCCADPGNPHARKNVRFVATTIMKQPSARRRRYLIKGGQSFFSTDALGICRRNAESLDTQSPSTELCDATTITGCMTESYRLRDPVSRIFPGNFGRLSPVCPNRGLALWTVESSGHVPTRSHFQPAATPACADP